MKPKYRIIREESFYGGYIGGAYHYRYSIQKKKFWRKWKEVAYYYDRDEALDHYNDLKSPKKQAKIVHI